MRGSSPEHYHCRLHDQHFRLTTSFPGISIVLTGHQPTPFLSVRMNIGAGAAAMGAFTGVFQNRFNPSANAIWTLGKHTITFGGSFAYTQLNTRDRDETNLG